MKTLLDDDEIQRAMTEPPEDTRAYFRGRCLAQYASEVVAASWDSVIFDVGRESLVRVPMMEPERGTKKHVGALFDRCASAKDLLEVHHQPADRRRVRRRARAYGVRRQARIASSGDGRFA